MQIKTLARAHARALVGVVAISSTLGLALGGAYLAGGAARAQVAQASGERVDAATGAITPAAEISPAGPSQDQQNAPDRVGLQKASFDTGPAATPFAGGSLSGRDLDCLTTAVYYEARGEGVAGQAAVAQVVLNRVRHPAFPKSVCGVVYQGVKGRGCQFSFACNGAMRGRKNGAAWNRAHEIATRAMGGFMLAGVGNATHFHATRVAPGWGGMVRVAQVGAHVFYRFGGKAGRPASFKARSIVASAAAEAAKPAYKLMRPSSIEGGELTLASADTTPAPVPAAPTAKPADQVRPSEAAKPAPPPEAQPAAVQAATAS